MTVATDERADAADGEVRCATTTSSPTIRSSSSVSFRSIGGSIVAKMSFRPEPQLRPRERVRSDRQQQRASCSLRTYVLSLAMAETRRGRSLKEGRGREGLLQLASYCAVCPSAPPRYLSLRRKLRNWRLAGFQKMCLGCEKLSNKLPAPKN